MVYNQTQLKFIQKKLIELTESFNKKQEGFGLILVYADLTTWISHAALAGYNVEKATGKMYRQKGNVRTYFEG